MEDFSELSSVLQKKCRTMISSFIKIDAKSLRQNAHPGWRLHKLESSPFLSLSIDMNFRTLAKIDNNRLSLFRVVKHDMADAPRINQNDQIPVPLEISGAILKPNELYDALIALGVDVVDIAAFRDLQTEDDLLNALVSTNEKIAHYALTLYETKGVVIPRVKHALLIDDQKFETILNQSFNAWEIYLHPSQEFLVNLPVDHRIAVAGSAGTGNTVSAWYRLKRLAEDGFKVGFIAPTDLILRVSEEKLKLWTANLVIDTYFLVPSSPNQIIQLANSVNHLIIDEGQEIPPTWLSLLSEFLKSSVKSSETGITIFYDINQLSAQYQLGDSRRFQERIESFKPALKSVSRIQFIDLYINYRNSREISKYYFEVLNQFLPNIIKSEIPIYSHGQVICTQASELSVVPALLAHTIKKLLNDYVAKEIAILYTSGKLEDYLPKLIDLGLPVTEKFDAVNKIIVAPARSFRGYEKKVVIVCRPKNDKLESKIGKAINFYIGLSRARDRLIVIEY